jgi:hypothetical protein
MSYLVQHAQRRPTSAGRPRRGARVDERLVLNRPQFDGGAHVRVFVEDTSGRKRRLRRTPPAPRIRLRIADCANQIALEFSLESPELRENSLTRSRLCSARSVASGTAWRRRPSSTRRASAAEPRDDEKR